MTDDTGRHRDRTPDQTTDLTPDQSTDLTTGSTGSTGSAGSFDGSSADLDPTREVSTTLHEERLTTGTELHESGRVRVKKHVETYPVEETVTRSVEHADDPERVKALEGDSGEVETLEDGSLSIPLFEEVLVVTKKLVVRERVIVRKRTVVDEHTLQTELRREHATIEADDETLLDDRRTGLTSPTGDTDHDTGLGSSHDTGHDTGRDTVDDGTIDGPTSRI